MVKYMGTYGYLVVNAYARQGTHYVPNLMKYKVDKVRSFQKRSLNKPYLPCCKVRIVHIL